MRKFMICVSVVTYLMCAANARAALPPGVPGAWCDYEEPSKCYTHEETDPYNVTLSNPAEVHWIYRKDSTGVRSFSMAALQCSVIHEYGTAPTHSGACMRIRGQIAIHYFKRLHKYEWEYPFTTAYYVTFIAQDGVVSDKSAVGGKDVQINEQFNKPDCRAGNRNPYVVVIDDGARTAPTADAPADYVAYCFPVLPPTPPVPMPPTDPTPPVPVPPTCTTDDANNGHGNDCDGHDDGNKCEKYTMRGIGAVRVFRKNTGCSTAKVLASRVTAGKPVAGWWCTVQHIGKIRAGRCVKSSGAKAGSIVGLRWRVR